MSRIDSALQADSYLYHTTSVSNLQSILRNGVQPTTDGHRDGLEHDLTRIAAEHGIEIPITRQDCVFCYASSEQATRLTQLGTPDSDEYGGLQSNDAIVVIDGQEIDDDVFVGEFRLISDAIDHQHMPEPDDVMISDSYEDALRRYADTLTRVEPFSSLVDICSDFRLAEVVVENGIPPGAIVGWIE
jgi:hypothetical protein